MPAVWPGNTRNIGGFAPSDLLSDAAGASALTHSGAFNALAEELLAVQLHIGATGAKGTYASISERLAAIEAKQPYSITRVAMPGSGLTLVEGAQIPTGLQFALPKLQTFAIEVSFTGYHATTNPGLIFGVDGTVPLVDSPKTLPVVRTGQNFAQPERSTVLSQTMQFGSAQSSASLTVKPNSNNASTAALSGDLIVFCWRI